MVENPLCDMESPSLVLNLNEIHVMRMKLLVTDVPAIGFPVRAKSGSFWVVLDVF